MNTRRVLTKSAVSLLALVTALPIATNAATLTWNTSGPWDVNATGTADTVQIATIAGSRVIISLSADDEITNLNGVGGGGGGAGAVYQTAGNLLITGPFADSNFSLGGIATSTAGYGFYGISGGSLQAAKISAGGRSIGAVGVLDISSGTVTATEKLAIARGNGASSTTEAASYGLINMTGGTVTTNTVSTAVPSIEMGYNTNSFAVFNLGGGVGTAVVNGLSSSTAGGLDLGNQVNAGTTTANLLTGGTLTVSRVYTASTATVGTQLLNFNGGTLKATATNFGGTFLTDTDIDAVTVYSGGGTIDNSGTGITIGRPLNGATGSGITTIAVTDGGSGYVGAPFVQITGGVGSRATAIANMVDDGTGNGTFKIGSISITSPGTFTDVTGLGVALQGGGALTAATVGAIATGANVSGGMTYIGGGTTTVTGVNTYTGKTTINAGTLQVGASERIADVSIVEINNSAKLQVQSFTETIGGLISATPAQAALVQHSEAGGSGTGTLIIDTAGNDYTFNGILRDRNTGGGVLAIQKSGAGTQTFNYTGTAAVINFTGGLTINGGTLKLSDSGNGRTIGSFASNVTNNATFVLENTGTNNQTFGRAISGSGNLVLTSTNPGGALTLTAANTYTGTTTINGGTVTLSGAGALANSSAVLLNSGSLIAQGSLNGVTVANAATNSIANTGGAALTIASLTFNGAGVLNLAYSGTPAIAVTGALANSAVNGQVTVNVSSLSWSNGLNNLINFGSFTGSIGGFTKGNFTGLSGRQTAGSLQVNGSNIALNVIGDNALWTGANGGFWRQFAQNSPTSATPAWKLQSGTAPTDFWIADNAVFDDTAAVTDATIVGGSITANTITFNNASEDYTILSNDGSGIAAGVLTKNGAASLTITTANTYAGGTTLNAGTLILNNMSAIGTGTLTINGGSLDSFIGGALSTNNAQAWNADFSFGGSSDFDMGNGAVTLGGAGNRAVTVTAGSLGVGEIKSAGAQGFVKQGPGILVVNSVGTVGAGSVIGGILNVAEGTLQINKIGTVGATSGDFMAAGLTGVGTITNGSNDERWLMINLAGSSSFSGSLENGGFGALGFAKLGGGTLTVIGSNNTYTGQTVLEGGILNVSTLADYGVASSIGARGAAQEVATNVGLLFRGGTLQYTGSTPQSTNRQIRISPAGGAIDASGSNPGATLNFTHSGTNADLFETGGTRTLTLTGSNTGENTFAISLINQDVSATSLLKSGIGKWVLTGANTYTGTTTVREGTLVLNGNRTAPSGGITVGDSAGRNATLEILDGDFNMGTNLFILSQQANSSTVNHRGGSITMGGTQMIVGNNVAGAVGTYNLSGGTLTGAASTTRGVILGTNGSTTGIFNLSGTGNFALGSSALQVGRSDDGNSTNSTGIFNQTGGTAAVGTLTIGGGTGGTNNAGTNGTLNLTGGTFSAASFTLLAAATNSTANITIGGTAQVTLPAFPTVRGTGATANITFDGGTLLPAASSAAYLGGLTNAFVTANGAKIDVASGIDITVSQPLVDASGQTGTLTKLGTGILTLSGANTYTGMTTVNDGRLLVNGSLSGATTVNGGGTLDGVGTLGAVTVNNGGFFAPGSGIGTLTSGALTFNDAATFALEFNIASSNLITSDLVNATSLNLALNNSAVLSLVNLGSNITLDAGTAITFLDYSGAWNGGSFANLPDDSTFVLGANAFRISYNGINNNDTAVVLVAVPEPGAATLLLGGLCSVLGLRRSRRRS